MALALVMCPQPPVTVCEQDTAPLVLFHFSYLCFLILPPVTFT